MPNGLPHIIQCSVRPGLCRCPARHAPHSSFPCDNCPERRKHARGCPAKPYPGDEAGTCTCSPLLWTGDCPRRQSL